MAWAGDAGADLHVDTHDAADRHASDVDDLGIVQHRERGGFPGQLGQVQQVWLRHPDEGVGLGVMLADEQHPWGEGVLAGVRLDIAQPLQGDEEPPHRRP